MHLVLPNNSTLSNLVDNKQLIIDVRWDEDRNRFSVLTMHKGIRSTFQRGLYHSLEEAIHDIPDVLNDLKEKLEQRKCEL